jgi:hypothetical protein
LGDCLLLLAVDIGERLAGRVLDDVTAGDLFDAALSLSLLLRAWASGSRIGSSRASSAAVFQIWPIL